jgi:excisionase family DNA binding protein
MEKLYTCEEAAAIYGVKTRTVWGWIRRGKLRACKIGRLYRLRASDLLELGDRERKTGRGNAG